MLGRWSIGVVEYWSSGLERKRGILSPLLFFNAPLLQENAIS
jgi:hypothetical protein